MKARYKGNNIKTLTIAGETVAFPSGIWVSLPTIAFYKRLKELPSIFDVACEYDLTPYLKHASYLRFKGKVIQTAHKPTVTALHKLRNLAFQAIRVDTGTSVFRVRDFTDSYLKGFVSALDPVDVLIGRSKGGIGDVLMTLPSVEAIATKYDNYALYYTCPEKYLPLVENNPFIAKSFASNVMQEEGYDVVYDMTRSCIQYEGRTQPNVDLNRTEIFARIGELSVENLPRPKVYFSPEEFSRYPYIDFVRSAKSDGIKTSKFNHLPKLTIGLCFNSSAAVRSYLYGEELVDQLVVEYPDADILIFQENQQYISSHPNVHVMTGFTLRDIALLICRCDLFFGPDTGLTHLAAALRIKTIWFFTHIDGKIRTKGYDNSTVIQMSNSCPVGHPCWYEFPCDAGGQREHLEMAPCIVSCSPQVVLDEVRKRLSTPDVSILLACHNCFEVTKECMRRLGWIKRYNDELILVDNGSTDETENYFGRVPTSDNYIYMKNDSNLGVITARNQGLMRSRGEYVWILDNDQYIKPHTLHNIKRTEGDIVGIEGWFINAEGMATRHDKCGMLNYVGAGGMFARRQTLLEVDFFDENYSPAWFEDPDICFKATQAGFSLGLCKDADVEHLAHTTTHSQMDFNSKKVWIRNREYFVSKWEKLTFAKPLCSIIILNHNAAEATIRCLSSIHRTTDFSEVEVIVVDNGSDDIDKQLLLTYEKPNVTYLLQDENLMVAKGRNLGASSATGEFLLFLDNDMVLPEGWLPILMSSCESFDAAATAPKVVDVNANKNDHVRFRSTIIQDGHIVEMTDDDVRDCDMLPGGATFVRRSVFDAYPLDEKFVYGVEDYDWCMRVRNAGFKFINTPAVVFHHVKNGGPRTITRYDDAERKRKGSSFIEDSIRLFLYRWSDQLPDQWRQSGWLKLAIGKDRFSEITTLQEVREIIAASVEVLYPDELIGEEQR